MSRAHLKLGTNIVNPLTLNEKSVENIVASSRPSTYSVEEWELRCKLAVAYRIADYFGWTQVIFNHITVKLPGTENEPDGPYFLINPLGLMFTEITASCLLKVNLEGEIIDHGTHAGGLFRQGYVIHSAIHEVRHDCVCCWHSHHENAAAISMTKTGILPISQESVDIVNMIAYHPFEGTANDMSERPRMQRNLGMEKKILILENHGPCTLGNSIENAFLLMYLVCRSCNYQQKAMAAVGGDLSKLNVPSPQVLSAMKARAKMNVLAVKKGESIGFENGGGGIPSPFLVFRAMARLMEDTYGAEQIYC